MIVLMHLCSSCVEGGYNLDVKTSPSDKNMNDLVSQIYDESQLNVILQFNGNINQLNDIYPIECLRKVGEHYRASYVGNNSIAIIVFDKSGKKLTGNIFSTQCLKADFDELEKGKSLDNVKNIDPKGEYLFLYTGRNDTPRISSHYTKDGYLITIEYDTSYNILSISEELI